MIPAHFAPILFSFILSCLMSLVAWGVSTFRTAGFPESSLRFCFGAWLPSWLGAFPVVLVVTRPSRRQPFRRKLRQLP